VLVREDKIIREETPDHDDKGHRDQTSSATNDGNAQYQCLQSWPLLTDDE